MAEYPHDTLPAELEALAGSVLAALPDEKRAAVVRVVQQIRNFHSGPLPDPDSLRAYAKLIPNGAERITGYIWV